MSPRSWRISVCSQEVCRASWKKHWHRLLPVSDAFGLLPAQKGKKYMQTVSCEAAVGVAGLLWGCHLLTISHAGESWRLSCPFLSPLTGAVAIISQHSSHYTASNANCIFFLLFTYLTWDFFFSFTSTRGVAVFPICLSICTCYNNDLSDLNKNWWSGWEPVKFCCLHLEQCTEPSVGLNCSCVYAQFLIRGNLKNFTGHTLNHNQSKPA